jgi:hypothetical protein
MAAGIRYTLGGWVASSLMSIPRFTQDADLMVDPFAGRESELHDALGSDYYVSDEASEQQWRDVMGLLKVRGLDLDLDYMRRAAEELGVVDLLDRALNQAS